VQSADPWFPGQVRCDLKLVSCSCHGFKKLKRDWLVEIAA
jgi:hypothetical protein